LLYNSLLKRCNNNTFPGTKPVIPKNIKLETDSDTIVIEDTSDDTAAESCSEGKNAVLGEFS